MEKVTYPELEFNNVSKADVKKLRAFLRAEETGKCSDGDNGFAETHCFTARYHYDPKTNKLLVEPIHLVPGLRGHRLQRIIQDVLNVDTARALATAADLPQPTPHSCATYNWVIGYLQNNTDFTLTYSGQNTDHGNVISVQNKIAPGNGPTQQGDTGAFQNQSPKDSTVGCYGDISWNIDGSTSITIHYGVNTLSTTAATVSINGPNASLYDATMDKRTHFYFACAYLYPTVTLSKVTG